MSLAGEISFFLQRTERRQIFLYGTIAFFHQHRNIKPQERFPSSNLKCVVITGVNHKINLHLLGRVFCKLEHSLCHDLGQFLSPEGQACSADGGKSDGLV